MNWAEEKRRRNARSTVYFAQPTDGGPIKVGMSIDIAARRQTLGTWTPQGVEIVATMPGAAMREAAVKWALRPWGLQGEWARSCLPVWRLIADVADHGDLSWLPAERDLPSLSVFAREVREVFGNRHEAAKALGTALALIPGEATADCGFDSHRCMYGRFAVERARRDGSLPRYLDLPLNDSQPQERAA